MGVRNDLTEFPLMDILVNVIGYAGFIGIATWHKSSDECILTIDHFLARGRKTGHWL